MDLILKIHDISPKISKKKKFQKQFPCFRKHKKHVFFPEFHLILGCRLTL